MAYTNRPDFGFYLSFEDPNDPAVIPTYVDFTTLFKSASAVARGRQYELGQTLAADPDVVLRDVNEYLNSANTLSPHYPNVDSYRRVLWMGLWPNTPIGNLFNAAYWGISGTVDPNLGPRDPSFESYAVGSTVGWLSPIGISAPVVGTTTPHTGTQDLTYTVGTTGGQGIAFGMRCMPGRYYTVSVYVRQSTASTQQIVVDSTFGQSTTTTGAYVRLSQTFLATKPEHICFIVTNGPNLAGTVLIDDIQMEQQPALNGNISFQFANTNWTPHGGTILQNNLFYKTPEFSLRLNPDGVSATPFFESDRATTVAVAGQQYIASGWIYSPIGTGLNQVDIRVNWYTSGNALISNPVGSPAILSVGVWTFFSTTFTAPATTGFVTVVGTITGTPTTANVVYFDQVQVVSTTPTAFTTTGPAIYPIMANFAERFQKYWENGEYTGKVQIPCVDALTALSATKIPTEYAAAVAASRPSFSYPLSATNATGTTYPDTSGNAFSPLAPYVSKYGPGGGLNATLMAIVGDPGAMAVGFTNTNTATLFGDTGTILGNGYANRGVAGTWSWPPLASTWAASLSAWVTCAPVTIPAVDFQLIAQAVLPGNGINLSTPLSLGVASTGQASVNSGGLTGLSIAQGGPVITDGKPHHIVGTVTQTAGGNTVTGLYVDGAFIGTNTVTTASLGGALTFTAVSFIVGGFFAYTAYEQILSGSAAWIVGWSRALLPADVTALWKAGGLGNAGETAGARVARHFATGQYPAPYRISTTTTSIMGPPSYTGLIDLGSDSQNTTIAEGGNFWIAPDGAPVLESRQDRWLRLTPLWTLGNGPGNSHFAEPEYDTDPTYVFATVQVTRNGGSTLTGGAPADVATAIKKYFGRTFTASVDLSTDAQAQDMANFVFYTHNHTLQRIASLTLDPASNPTLWALAFGIEVGNRVRVIFTSPAANGGFGFTNTADFFVETVTHDSVDMDAGTWKTVLLLSPIGNPFGTATLQPFVLDSGSLGVLNLNILGW